MQERNQEVHPVGGKDKIERYDWKLLDQPGELRMLNKKVLRVDEQYQREATEPKVKEIARAWSWLACGALLVAEREGVFFVFDGQHRALAALRRSDITHLPCVVFRTAGSKEEAEAFLRANKNRKPLNGLAKFRAATAAEQPAALLVQQLITAAGRTASESSTGTTVRCLALMMNHAERQPEVLKRTWPLIAEVCLGKPVHERVMDGLLYIENHLPEGESLMDKEWRKRALRVSYDGLLGAANRFAAAYSKGGAKVWALGMVEAMNKGCRTHMKLAGEEEG
jgi:hypothetical protein